MLNRVKQWIHKATAPRGSAMTRLGARGTAVWGGYVSSIEESSDLQGSERYTTFSKTLVNTSIVAAGVRYFLNLISKAGWKAEPAEGGGAKAEEIAEFMEEIINDMATPWRRVVRRAAMYRFYGFNIQEWTAKRREDGQIGLLDVEPRAQKTIERWDVDDAGLVRGVWQRSPQTMNEIYLPREKIVYIVDDSLNDSPEGLGLLRHTAEPARRLRRYEQLEGWGFETDLRGMPVGYGPFEEMAKMVKAGDISQAQADAIALPLKNFITNHIKTPQQGMVLDSAVWKTADEKKAPSGNQKWWIDLLKSGPTSQKEVADAIQRLNREIARILGFEEILLGETGAGSLAMSRDKSQQSALIVDSTMEEVNEGVQKDLVRPVMKLNGWPKELEPTLKPDKIQHREVTEITTALAEMAQAGVVIGPDDPVIGEVRDLLGLSRPIEIDMDLDASLLDREKKPKDKPKKEEEELPESADDEGKEKE